MEIKTDRLAKSMCQSAQDAMAPFTSSFDINHFGDGDLEALISEVKQHGSSYEVQLKGLRLPAFAAAQVNLAEGMAFGVPAAVMPESISTIEIVIEPALRR